MGLNKIECTDDELAEKLDLTRWAMDFDGHHLSGQSGHDHA